MTMITVIQIGALTFMTLLPVALSVILYMAERQPWTKKFSYGVKQAIIGVLFGLVAVLATEAGIPVNGAVLNVRNAAPLTAGLLFGGPAHHRRRYRRCIPLVRHLLGRRGLQPAGLYHRHGAGWSVRRRLPPLHVRQQETQLVLWLGHRHDH